MRSNVFLLSATDVSSWKRSRAAKAFAMVLVATSSTEITAYPYVNMESITLAVPLFTRVQCGAISVVIEAIAMEGGPGRAWFTPLDKADSRPYIT